MTNAPGSSNARSPTQGLGDAGEAEVNDRKDQADAASRAVIGSAEVERDLAELREIAGARERIAAGHYGECVACGTAIDQRRLQAQPAASRCIACQSEAEHPTHRPARG